MKPSLYKPHRIAGKNHIDKDISHLILGLVDQWVVAVFTEILLGLQIVLLDHFTKSAKN